MQIRAFTSLPQNPRMVTQTLDSSADPVDRWTPQGEVARTHPKPNFPPSATIESVVGTLESQWKARLDGKERCVVGILVERGWVPKEEHDEVLNIADAVMDSGGLPKLLYLGKGTVPEQMKSLHALAVPGGRDVDPSKYGAQLGPHMDPNEPDPAFDDFEIAAIRLALEEKMPLLGHCRGAQILNVAAGGTMTQDIPHEFHSPEGWGRADGLPIVHKPEWVRNNYAMRIYPSQLTVVEEGTRIHQIGGDLLQGWNGDHHQCIDKVAPGFTVVARAVDGLIEGIERAGVPWQAGYQCHFEGLRYTDSRFQGVYDNLVADGERFKNGTLGLP